MSARIFSSGSFTPVAVADNANFTDNGYMAIQGGSSTQMVKVQEVQGGGQATTTTPTALVLARDSTVGATLTALSGNDKDAACHPSTAALAAPAVPFVASTTKPKRSTTLGLQTFSFNAFGGRFQYQAAPGYEPTLLGNTASLGEMSLSALNVGTPGLMAAHIQYEPL